MQSLEELGGILKVVSLTVSCAGMIIVGFQLADISLKEVKIPYYLKLIGVRTIAAMAIIGVLIFAEYTVFNSLETDDYKMLFLVSLFPVATNVTVFASFLGSEQEKPALIVVISALLSLVLVSIATLFLM